LSDTSSTIKKLNKNSTKLVNKNLCLILLLLNNINLYFTIFYQNLLIYIRDAALEAAAFAAADALVSAERSL
jgi:hypothetical protein